MPCSKSKLIRIISFLIILMFLLPLCKSSATNFCKKDEDCDYLNICNLNENKCVHKKIFSDFTKEITGLLMIVVGSALSNAGGIGGGGLLIPILLLVLNFYTHEAIPISKLMIFTGALTSFILGFRQKHPMRNSITIDYNIPMLLVPMLLFGTMVGVTLNKVTPPWLILISLTAVLIINTYKTLKKGVKLYQEEKVKLEGSRELSITDKNSVKVAEENYNDDSRNFSKIKELKSSRKDNKMNKEYYDFELHSDYQGSNSNTADTNADELLKIEEKKDLRKLPFDKIIFMVICYIVMLLVSFLKGSDYMKSLANVKLCSKEYWFIYFMFCPFAITITYMAALKIKKEYSYRLSINYPYNETDIKWDNIIFFKFPCYSFISGLMAGLLGIGGGLILGPLLLELGLHPIVSTATSNFLVLFTSSSTSIQFILLGMMNLDFGIACTISSTIGSYIGTILIQKLIEKTKRSSYIIFSLGVVLGLSTLLIPGHTLINLIQQVKEGKSIWRFNSPC